MANFVYNIALGRTAELYNRVDVQDPVNAALEVVIITTTETDTTLKRLDTLQEITGNVNTAEVTNTNYTRKTIIETDITALAPDDVNDRMDLDIPDQTWTAVAAGDSWSDALICYDPDRTGGVDSEIIPCTHHDFIIVPDGSDITMQIDPAGFFRAQ